MSVQHEVNSADLYLNSQLIDKSVALGPKPQASPGELFCRFEYTDYLYHYFWILK